MSSPISAQSTPSAQTEGVLWYVEPTFAGFSRFMIDIITVCRYNDYEKEGDVAMILSELLKKQNMTKYRLSKLSAVPYSTLNDLCNGKTSLEKCSAETVYRLARELHVSMEELLAPCFEKRCSFELFKSNVCHKLKRLGDIDFLIETLQSNEIRSYYDKKWYPESLYLLAMVDYLSRINGIALCRDYDDIRERKLSDVLFPSGVLALAASRGSDAAKQQAIENAIPEFLRFNIVESEIRNVN